MSFTTTWKRSKQPRKQRKYRHQAPLHIKQKFVGVHLSTELRKKYGTRTVQVRQGDKIKVMRGQYAKKEGKVDKVSIKHEKVFMTGLEIARKDGTKSPIALIPSNLMITDLNLNDRKRKAKLEESNDKKKPETSEVSKITNKQKPEPKTEEKTEKK